MSHKTYLIRVFLYILAGIGLVVCLNAFIDPYSFFGTPRIEGISARKPYEASRVRMVKPYQILRSKPASVIAGNSRPELGINPESNCWRDTDRPIYNAGLPGIGIYEQARMIQGAVQTGGVRTVLWGLDLLDFLSRQPATNVTRPAYRSEIGRRLPLDTTGKANPHYYVRWLQDLRDSTISLSTLTDSIRTIWKQADPLSSTRTDNGFNPAQDYISIIRAEGQYVLFEQKNAEVLSRVNESGLQLFPAGSITSADFEIVRSVIELAESNDIELYLFINPYHADYLTILNLAGYWSALESWKRKLVYLADKAERTKLYDFNAFDEFSTTPPPARHIKNKSLRGYWEPAHYKKEVGDLMLSQMLGTNCAGSDNNLGVQITRTNLDRHLGELRQQISRYFEEAPGRVQQLNAER